MTDTAARSSDPTFTYVHPDRLRFDPANPRFVTEANTQEQIQALLEKEPHLALELTASFLENGFIDYEPLVVRSENEHYIVVEGNRRLAAIRHILAHRTQYLGKSERLGDLQRIPVLVFPTSPSPQRDKEQRVYLGVRHLFGFREWPPESKARYLDAQIKTPTDLDRLARELNIKRQDIQRYLIPYRLRKDARRLWDEHRDQDFWVLGEGLSRAGIKAYIDLDVDRASLKIRGFSRPKLAFLLKFIYGTPAKGRSDRVVKETRQLSSLAKALQHKRATAALEKGRSLAEASVLLASESESRSRLKELLGECKAIVATFKSEPGATELSAGFKAFADAARRFLKDGR